MADNTMKLILEMIDNASPAFKKANQDAIKQVRELQKASNETSKEIINDEKKKGEEIKKTTKEGRTGYEELIKSVRKFRSNLLLIGAVIGAVALATNEWAKRNKETRESLLEMQIAGSKVLAFVGKMIPATYLLGAASKAINNFVEDDVTDKIARASNELKEFNKELQDSAILFQTGAITASEYYDTLVVGAVDSISQNRLMAQSLNELASLQGELENENVLRSRTRIDEQVNLLSFYKENYIQAHKGMAAFTVTFAKSVSTNLSGAFANIASGVATAKEAFKQLGQAMIQTVVQFIAQKVIAAVIEKTLLASTVASSTAAGAAVAAAWAPAAALVSLATFGANAAPAAAGIAAVSALSSGVALSSRATQIADAADAAGGVSAPARGIAAGFGGFQADGGDYLVNKPTMFIAGEAGPERATFTPLGGGNNGSSFGDVNIFIQGGVSQEGLSIQDMAEKLGFEFERQVRVARG